MLLKALLQFSIHRWSMETICRSIWNILYSTAIVNSFKSFFQYNINIFGINTWRILKLNLGSVLFSKALPADWVEGIPSAPITAIAGLNSYREESLRHLLFVASTSLKQGVVTIVHLSKSLQDLYLFSDLVQKYLHHFRD